MNGLRLTLILWLFFSLASWPSSLAAPSHIEPGNGLSGGKDESYLSVARGPEWLSDVAGPVYLDMQAMEPETKTQTRTTDHTGESDWAGEAARTGDRGLRQPSTRGEATYYHPSLAWADDMRGGGKYNPRDATIGAVADIRGEPVVELGRMLEVCHQEADTCIVVQVMDTGYLGENNIDLSEAGFERLAPLSRGRIPIEWRVIDSEG